MTTTEMRMKIVARLKTFSVWTQVFQITNKVSLEVIFVDVDTLSLLTLPQKPINSYMLQ